MKLIELMPNLAPLKQALPEPTDFAMVAAMLLLAGKLLSDLNRRLMITAIALSPNPPSVSSYQEPHDHSQARGVAKDQVAVTGKLGLRLRLGL